MTNHLVKRGSVYYFRRKVPIDLVPHFGRTQIMFSLETRDPAEAKRLAAEHTVSTDRHFDALRGKTRPKRMTPDESRDYLRDYERDEHYDADPEHFEAQLEGAREARKTTDSLLVGMGLPTATQLAHYHATGGFSPDDLPKMPERALAPRVAPVPALVTVSVPEAIKALTGRSKTLRDVIPDWVRRTKANKAAIGSMSRAMYLFEECLGHVAVSELKKAHGAEFVRFLLDSEKRGFKSKTAGNHAAAITALVNIAVKEDYIDRNPLDLTFDTQADSEQRTPWTDAELKLMFDHAVFSGAMATVPEWHNVKPEDGRALVLMLAHSGARIGEIAQLRRGDFVTRLGIRAIRITAEAGTVKTKESEREIPLAQHLLDDPWFAAWIEGIDGTRPNDPAMPSFHGRARDCSDVAGRWFTYFRDDSGITPGRLQGSHKFRHWIRSALADHGVGDATADSITGHAAKGSAGRKIYTATASLPVMLEALNRLTFPDIAH
jgi:integrase